MDGWIRIHDQNGDLQIELESATDSAVLSVPSTQYGTLLNTVTDRYK